MNIQELQLAEQGNFYDIIHPPKKMKTSINRYKLEESCFNEIIKNLHIFYVENDISGKDADYISKFYFKDGNFYVDGLIKSNILNTTLSLDIPLNKYVLVKYNETTEKQKCANEDKKIFFLDRQIPNIYKEGFVFYNLKEKTFVFEKVNINWYELSKLEKKIQNYKDFSPSMFLIKPPHDLLPKFTNPEDLLCNEKIELGEKYGVMSMLPSIGSKTFEKAKEKRIFSFKDGNFDSFLEEEMKGETLRTIRRVQRVNSPLYKNWYFIDDKIGDDPTFKILQGKFKEGKCIYWDAEYTSYQQYLYGFYHEDGTYEHIWEDDNELRLCKRVFDFFKKYPDHAFIYYAADKSKFQKLLEKTGISYPDNFFDLTIDLLPIIKKYCAFKGAYNFSIKSIEKVFTEKGFITETYKDGNCKNGLESISIFKDYLKTNYKQNSRMSQRIRNDIIEYNRLDCQNQKIILNQLLTLK